MAIDRVDAYLEAHRGDFEEQLKALLRIPSVSAQPDHDADTRRAAEFLLDDFLAMGFDSARADRDERPPAGLRRVAPGSPAGRPSSSTATTTSSRPSPSSPWTTADPFEPVVRDGNIIARGATDDKGQMFTHLKAAEGLAQGRRRPAGERQIPDRGRGGGRRREPRSLREGPPRRTRLRLRRDLRHQPVRPRHPRHHLRPEGPGLLRAGGEGAEVRPPLRDVRRDRRQPSQRPGRDPGEPEGRRRSDPDRGVLRPRPPPRSLGAGRVRQAPVLRRRLPRPDRRPLARRRGGLHHPGAALGPADLRRQRDLRRLPGAGSEDRPPLQGRREAELPARARPGPEAGRRPVPGPRREGHAPGSYRRGDRAPRRPGRPRGRSTARASAPPPGPSRPASARPLSS